MVNPKSLENLKNHRAKPGQVLNPSGKNGSEERYLTGLIRKAAKQAPKGELWDKLFLKRPALKGKTYGELLEETLWEEAIIRREPQAYKLLMERCDGKIPLPLTGDEGGPVEVHIIEDENWNGTGKG